MKSKWFEYKAQAIKSRRKGLSIKDINKKFGIPLSTLSGWLKDVELTNKQKEILKGNIFTIVRHLKELMKKCAGEYEFEKAQLLKEKIELLEKFREKSTVVNPRINNVDVFSIVSDEKFGYVNFMKVVNGAIVQAHTIELKKKLDESPEELLSIAITDLRQRFNSDAKEIITNLVPQRGDKRKLLELSERNAKHYRFEKQRFSEKVDPKRHIKRILNQMMKDLRLKELPVHIECFDNSNIQGAYPVAAMAVFKNARPSKKDFRHYNIRTVQGPDGPDPSNGRR